MVNRRKVILLEWRAMLFDRYILDGHEPVLCPNIHVWARWYETANRHVAQTFIPGGIWVSTVFLGIDHGFGNFARPILFETMVFGTEHDYERRYATWDQALLGHQEVVAEVWTFTNSATTEDTASQSHCQPSSPQSEPDPSSSTH